MRLLSRNTNDRFDEGFWRRRPGTPWTTGKPSWARTTAGCRRVIFGEADHFPGLTVDRFGDILVTEVLSLGMEVRKDLLYPLLVELLEEDGVAVRAIYERSDAPSGTRRGCPGSPASIPPRPGHGSGRPPPPGGERHPVRRGLHPRPEDRLLSGPEV